MSLSSLPSGYWYWCCSSWGRSGSGVEETRDQWDSNFSRWALRRVRAWEGRREERVGEEEDQVSGQEERSLAVGKTADQVLKEGEASRAMSRARRAWTCVSFGKGRVRDLGIVATVFRQGIGTSRIVSSFWGGGGGGVSEMKVDGDGCEKCESSGLL